MSKEMMARTETYNVNVECSSLIIDGYGDAITMRGGGGGCVGDGGTHAIEGCGGYGEMIEGARD